MEFATKILPLDDKLQNELQRLEDEGWQLVAGVKPMAIYFVGRIEQPVVAGLAKMTIDDSKVSVIRARKET